MGSDREMDLHLAPYDVLGSMAHITMLKSVGLLPADELPVLLTALRDIYAQTLSGDFAIEEGVEDVHSQVELLLTRRLGDLGKKIHSGRSRNDQVLLDIKLYSRAAIEEVVSSVDALFAALQQKSEQYKAVLLPGYTHLQVAMPSSFGLFFGAYAEGLTDDMHLLAAAWKIVNQNPLGAAAGYGSSFPLNRTMTTELLGFDDLSYNVVHAQMGRGRTERTVAFALGAVAATLARLAVDGCLYTSQNFGFIRLPNSMTTGSSIMPHKKNPDVFELIRARCNKIQSLSNSIAMVTGNLPSGYFRDMQVIKEMYIPVFRELLDCLELMTFAIENLEVSEGLMADPKYRYAFSVEAVNQLVLQGVPFRDAYRTIGEQIENDAFDWNGQLHHVHEGSIGNLCTDRIAQKMERIRAGFEFGKVHQALTQLLQAT